MKIAEPAVFAPGPAFPVVVYPSCHFVGHRHSFGYHRWRNCLVEIDYFGQVEGPFDRLLVPSFLGFGCRPAQIEEDWLGVLLAGVGLVVQRAKEGAVARQLLILELAWGPEP